jgi:hypothetical protein
MKSGFENGNRVPVTDPEDSGRSEEELSLALAEMVPGTRSAAEALDFTSEEQRVIESPRLQRFIEQEVGRRLFDAQTEVVLQFCFLVKDAKKPRRLVYQLMYAAGMGAAVGGSASMLAKQFGISKQAFEQGADRALASLGMRKNGLGKSEAARKKYADGNFRRGAADNVS